MAVNMAELARESNSALEKGIIMGLLERSYIMQKIPFENIDDLGMSVLMWDRLPSVGFRKMNAAYAESTGTTKQRSEALADLGKDIDVDTAALKAKTVVNPRTLQTKMSLKSVAYFFNDQFINGDTGVNPDGFDGVRVRVGNMPARQTLDAATLFGAALDLSTGAARDAAGKNLADFVNFGFDLIEEGKPDLILTNDLGRRYLRSALMRSALLDNTKDAFDRDIPTWDGVPIVDMGVLADQSTKVIADNHDDTTQSGAASRTSIYLVKFGVGEALHGIQNGKIDTRDLGELPTLPVLRTRMQWFVGLANWSDYSIARLKNIKLV